MSVVVVGEAEVFELLPMRDCIEAMEHMFAALASCGAVQPPRIIAWQPGQAGAIATMPAWLGEPPWLGAKVISVFPQNRTAGRESHQGFVVLFETQHGVPRAIIHAGAITAIRTAAVSAVATRRLAGEDAHVLAILGSGVQAGMHLAAMREVRSIRSVRVWSRTPEHARAFAERFAESDLSIEACADPESAVRGADIICTVTAATSPVLLGRWLIAGQHVNAAGASVPPFRELDTEAVVRSRVFVDSRESALREPDDLLAPLREGRITQQHILGELAELASGAVRGRSAESEITLFKSVGLAIEDLAAGNLVYERALESGTGQVVHI
ncbi:MAG TPA: ornithine cyclodeaminase family protein [Candidatus Baltobacteraceae bacterium]|jgi:ornithine cyclodeaminase|nr:ornithine cyclodeaminase family protein [Candidatus Baltobacteraceae bacterium]